MHHQRAVSVMQLVLFECTCTGYREDNLGDRHGARSESREILGRKMHWVDHPSQHEADSSQDTGRGLLYGRGCKATVTNTTNIESPGRVEAEDPRAGVGYSILLSSPSSFVRICIETENALFEDGREERL